jgi:dolichol-phosphate mannosyltransferase
MISQNRNEKIKKVIIIPTYLETESLNSLLSNLVPTCSNETAIVICDDSGPNLNKFYESLVSKIRREKELEIMVDFSEVKNGRGHAIFRGFQLSTKFFPNADFFLECDADESHRVEDINMILDHNPNSEFVIGSRYLKQSKILGWPITRRIFSKFLNILIPRILKIETSDATNGLRRYSRTAVNEILQSQIRTSGFIVLSEYALILKRYGIYPEDVPTTFINRKIGSSTVTFRELINSAKGLLRMVIRTHE